MSWGLCIMHAQKISNKTPESHFTLLFLVGEFVSTPVGKVHLFTRFARSIFPEKRAQSAAAPVSFPASEAAHGGFVCLGTPSGAAGRTL